VGMLILIQSGLINRQTVKIQIILDAAIPDFLMKRAEEISYLA
jgi:hypothetical protein